MSYQPMQYVYQPAVAAAAYTVVLLHGTGGDERDLLPLGRRFGTDVHLLGLRGNVSESGMPRFFRRRGMGVFDEEDLVFRTHEMVAFIKETAAKEKFDSNKLIALGYSNGANIAGSTLVLYPEFFAGAVLFRPMQPFREMPDFANTTHTPVFMSNGISDPTIGTDDAERYAAALQAGGFDVSHHLLPAGHELSPDDLQRAKSWFREHVGPDR